MAQSPLADRTRSSRRLGLECGRAVIKSSLSELELSLQSHCDRDRGVCFECKNSSFETTERVLTWVFASILYAVLSDCCSMASSSCAHNSSSQKKPPWIITL